MGFSTEAIFMQPKIAEEEELELLYKLGLTNLSYAGKVDFEETMTAARRSGVYIGHCGDSTYIVFTGILLLYIGIVIEDLNPWEKALSKIYPDKLFLSILNFEVVNGYSYHLFKSGISIRKKDGSHPDVYRDYGEELDLEKEYYEKKEIIDGREIYFTKPWNENQTELDQWTHDQIGGSIAFYLTKMMAGVEYGQDPMFEATVNKYVPTDNITIDHSHWDIHKILFQKFPELIPREVRSLGVLGPQRKGEAFTHQISNHSEAHFTIPKFDPHPSHIKYPEHFHPVEAPVSTIVSVELDASPKDVWQTIIDVQHWSEWHPATQKIWVEGNGSIRLKPSAKFHWHTLGMYLEGKILEFDRRGRITWKTKCGGVQSFHAWEWVATETGVKITLTNTQRGWLARLAYWLNPKRMENYHLNLLECLQKRLS